MKKPSDDSAVPASEKTPLLQPSASSTERPSKDNLIMDLVNHSEERGRLLGAGGQRGSSASLASEIQLSDLGGQGSQADLNAADWLANEDKKEQSRRAKDGLKRCAWLSLAVAALLAVLIPAYLYVDHERQPQPLPVPSSEDQQHMQRQKKKNDAASRAQDDNLEPLSWLHPVNDLHLPLVDKRPKGSMPPRPLTEQQQLPRRPLPTNAWYQNWIMAPQQPEERHQIYSVPYILDAVGPIPGIRVHPPFVTASSTVIQMNTISDYGFTLGAAPNAAAASKSDEPSDANSRTTDGAAGAPAADASSGAKDGTMSHQYTVQEMNNLGVTVEWEYFPMRSSIVKGMPYVTMVYNKPHLNYGNGASSETVNDDESDSFTEGSSPRGRKKHGRRLGQSKAEDDDKSSQELLPTIASSIKLAENVPVVVDQGWTNINMTCDGSSSSEDGILVESELEVSFHESDFTWLIFVSQPVYMQCVTTDAGGVLFQVLETRAARQGEESTTASVPANPPPLVLRVALHKSCTSGQSAVYCHPEQMHPTALMVGQGKYGDMLRRHAHLYPGPNTKVYYSVVDEDDSTTSAEANHATSSATATTAKIPGTIDAAKLTGSAPDPDNAGGDDNSVVRKKQIRLLFDWDVQSFSKTPGNTLLMNKKKLKENETMTESVFDKDKGAIAELITFALPHHMDLLSQQQQLGQGFVGASKRKDERIYFGVARDDPENLYCASSLVGPACLVEGSKWTLVDEIEERVDPFAAVATAPAEEEQDGDDVSISHSSFISFRASRPPAPWVLPELVKSIRQDLRFELPAYYVKGGGDTYFSGKMLAKLARVLMIAQEVVELCDGYSGRPRRGGFASWFHRGDKTEPQQEQTDEAYRKACQGLDLPSQETMDRALRVLRTSTEVWLKPGKAVTPFVFDSSWGGVVSCGCDFKDDHCRNKFPECPGFSDPGMNFGNAFYNDCHFHYGYHIYAAAVVSHLDPEWGREQFEYVLLLIRSIANPSPDDPNFPAWRHKDWYQGHSWASGIASPVYPNGKNQESSSESIAAWEAIALYGQVMSSVGQKFQDDRLSQSAQRVARIGQVLTATELRASRTYWHVKQVEDPDTQVKIYPSSYTAHVVGILWQLMAQFQTWFGMAPYLMYGIQLLPLTAIGERRDSTDLAWANQAYGAFSKSCDADLLCKNTGWGVLELALMATVGYPELAMEEVLQLPAEAFDGPAGDGHSLTNTLWYISTRPAVSHPPEFVRPPTDEDKHGGKGKESGKEDGSATPSNRTRLDCFRPQSCTDYVLDTIAGLYSCRQRITWLIQERAYSQMEACARVASIEHAQDCGKCNPYGVDDGGNQNLPPRCPPCNVTVCESDELNRCPQYDRTFLCLEGDSQGGCINYPWSLEGPCESCCEISTCPRSTDGVPGLPGTIRAGTVADCPPCEEDICESRLNQCPSNGKAPYLCYEGPSSGGCSPQPWFVGSNATTLHRGAAKQCQKCCTVAKDCTRRHH